MVEYKQSEINNFLSKINDLRQVFNTYVLGQDRIFDFIMAAFLTRTHILLEGVPGLAKTRSVNLMAKLVNATFKRIQFTPDLLPTDIMGSEIFNPKTGEFYVKQGPIFANIILADEINRAPAKVQSALLEAMQERQVTIAGKTFRLSEFFIVLATENPIEQEGTFPLSEAQTDRFATKLIVDYPSMENEIKILELLENPALDIEKLNPLMTTEDILNMRDLVNSIKCVAPLKEYIIKIIDATRYPEKYGLGRFKKYIKLGASPRAGIYFMEIGKVVAFLRGRTFVLPEDIHAIRHEILRHRVLLSFEAFADDIKVEALIDEIFKVVPIPKIDLVT